MSNKMRQLSGLVARIGLICALALFAWGAAPLHAGENSTIRVKITAGDKTLYADFLDNATTKSLIAKFPLTLPMQDLYGREMCYRFDEALPAREAGTSGYAVGDIAYWTPRHSFVIFYKQNGEVISNLQKVGHIASGVELFATTGDTDVRFELAK